MKVLPACNCEAENGSTSKRSSSEQRPVLSQPVQPKWLVWSLRGYKCCNHKEAKEEKKKTNRHFCPQGLFPRRALRLLACCCAPGVRSLTYTGEQA